MRVVCAFAVLKTYFFKIYFCVFYSIKTKFLCLGGRYNYSWLKDDLWWLKSKTELFRDVGRNIKLQRGHFKSPLIASCQTNSPVITWLKHPTLYVVGETTVGFVGQMSRTSCYWYLASKLLFAFGFHFKLIITNLSLLVAQVR
jgi:hypothetical protein